MHPTQGLSYWVSTLFELRYHKGEVYIGYESIIPVQREKCWVHHAVCLEVEDKKPSWSPRETTYSLMYFIKLEEDGMPYSENKFVVDNSCVFDFDCQGEAIAHSRIMCDEYVSDIFRDRINMLKTLLSVGSWGSKTVYVLDWLSKMSK